MTLAFYFLSCFSNPNCAGSVLQNQAPVHRRPRWQQNSETAEDPPSLSAAIVDAIVERRPTKTQLTLFRPGDVKDKVLILQLRLYPALATGDQPFEKMWLREFSYSIPVRMDGLWFHSEYLPVHYLEV